MMRIEGVHGRLPSSEADRIVRSYGTLYRFDGLWRGSVLAKVIEMIGAETPASLSLESKMLERLISNQYPSRSMRLRSIFR
jgi:hypothetical protein